MSETKEFPLGVILSIVQRRMISVSGSREVFALVCHILLGPDAPPGIYAIDEQAMDLCVAELTRQLPWVARVPRRPGADFAHASVHDWAQLDLLERRLGPRHPVRTRVKPSTE